MLCKIGKIECSFGWERVNCVRASLTDILQFNGGWREGCHYQYGETRFISILVWILYMVVSTCCYECRPFLYDSTLDTCEVSLYEYLRIMGKIEGKMENCAVN